MEKQLKGVCNIKFNPPTVSEHAGEVEHMIRKVKERTRALISVLLWKKVVL